jgi:calcineurin-like phosphoesterase family protein
MLFTHIPIHEQSMGRFDACVHGHMHDNVVTKQERGETVVDLRYLNICVEHTEYKPITLEDIQKVMRDRKGTIIE